MIRGLFIAALIAAPAAATPLQQAYDAATAALEAGRYAEARDGYLQVLSRMRGRNDPADRAAATLRVQLARAQLGIGDPEGAERTVAAALSAFPAGSAADRVDRAAPLGVLGNAREAELDLSGARQAYEQELDTLGPAGDQTDIWQARVGRARATLFADPARRGRTWSGRWPTRPPSSRPGVWPSCRCCAAGSS